MMFEILTFQNFPRLQWFPVISYRLYREATTQEVQQRPKLRQI